MKKLLLSLPPEIHTGFKSKCALNGVAMSHVIVAMIEHYISTDELGITVKEKQPKKVASHITVVQNINHESESTVLVPYKTKNGFQVKTDESMSRFFVSLECRFYEFTETHARTLLTHGQSYMARLKNKGIIKIVN